MQYYTALVTSYKNCECILVAAPKQTNTTLGGNKCTMKMVQRRKVKMCGIQDIAAPSGPEEMYLRVDTGESSADEAPV